MGTVGEQVFAACMILGCSWGAASAAPLVPKTVITDAAYGAWAIIAADVDGDGDADAISAWLYADTVAWHENASGDGSTWTTHYVSLDADDVRGLSAADVDGDGDIDLLSASRGDNKIAWYENLLGNGSFWWPHIISVTAEAAYSVSAADVDGDGDVDAVSASRDDSKIAWYKNLHGGGTAWLAHTISTDADGAVSVLTADVDGDGDVDALSASRADNKVAWYENLNGDGSMWVDHTIGTNADGAGCVYAADVDGDGDIDALSASWGNDSVAWYENVNGDGSVWLGRIITDSAAGASSVFAVDVDDDGDIDVLSASDNDDTVAWYENVHGDGSVWISRNVTTTAAFATSVSAADVDGDGRVETLSASLGDRTIAWYDTPGELAPDIRLRSTEGTVPVTVTYEIIGGPVMPFEFGLYTSADRRLDVADELLGAIWIDGAGDLSTGIHGKTFAVPAYDYHGGELNLLAAADHLDDVFEDDGDPFNEDNTLIFASHYDSDPFGAQSLISTNANGAVSAFAADVDGDGDMDVLSASFYDDKIAWYENEAGDGSIWTEHTVTTLSNGAHSVYAADVDGDGDIDAVDGPKFDNVLSWYENVEGDGSVWLAHTITSTASLAVTVVCADVDGDADLDVLSAPGEEGKISWYENTGGDGLEWTPHVISATADEPASVAAADVDGDGDIDVFSAARVSNLIAWYENTSGDGTAWSAHAIGAEQYGVSVCSTDVDGDGDVDVLSASFGQDKITWYENLNGDGSAWTSHTISAAVDGAHEVFAVDVDGDGDQDVLSAAWLGHRVVWHENLDGAGGEWTGHILSFAGGATSVFAADLDGDGDMDALSAAEFEDAIAWYENLGELRDLQMQDTTANGFADLSVTYKIAGAADSFEIGFYRSLDAEFDSGDELLWTSSITSAIDMTVGTHTKVFAIGGPALLPGAGAVETNSDYYLLAVADHGDELPENDTDPFNEDNTAVFRGVYHLAGRGVYIHGTLDGGDSVAAVQSSDVINVLANQDSLSYARDDVTGLRIRVHEGNDLVRGTNIGCPMRVWGGAGADFLLGGVSHDILDGGTGDDWVFGSLGNDVVSGGDGDDTLIGGGGADLASGGAGQDQCWTAEVEYGCEPH